MELRRLEALQNLSGGTSKVIFDLAKPFDGETRAAAMAAALGSNVRVADDAAKAAPGPGARVATQAAGGPPEREEREAPADAPVLPGRRA